MIVFALSSCTKKETKSESNNNTQFTITGKLYNKMTMAPIKNFAVAIRQSDKSFNPQHDYKITDPNSITDSTGYFSITYYPTENNGGINLYKVPSNYSCCIDLEIIDNIPKGVNYEVGTIY